jgi:glycosyltransferase involved in cell wall biosynthesis
MKIELSYIIATYNRLAFLKITLEKLLAELQPGEEIVIVDGNSTDGTKEYLQQLFEQVKIHQFISEPDKNQAHGWNKAMLMAKGTLIKKIIDDDVFDYQSIRKCKDHMLQYPLVDVVLSNDLSSLLNDHKTIHRDTRIPEFKKWCKGLLPSFSFGDVHMLIRRSSLSYIGLYNTAYVMMDWEYSLRISYLKANIVYYTGYNALSVAHPQTVTSSANKQLINLQGKRGAIFYEYDGDNSDMSYWSRLKIFIGEIIYRPKKSPCSIDPNQTDITGIYEHYYKALTEINKDDNFTFLSSR